MSDYLAATKASIEENAKRHGIKPSAITTAIKERFGKTLAKMDAGELRDANRALPDIAATLAAR